MNPVKYSIKDLERLTGIKAHTIRMWEKRYGVINPLRTETNIRYYSDQDLQKLLNISLLNQNGLKISMIADLTDAQIVQEVTNLSGQEGQLDADINNMVMAAIDLQEEQFDRVLNNSLLKIGFEKTFCKVIFPLFDKLSVMWQIGRINACQERFIFNLVRQKLMVATDGLVGSIDPSKGLFLLFMPAEHENELGLLYVNYLLRKHSYQVVYLGAGVPFEHINRLQNPDRFDELFIGFNHVMDAKAVKKYIQDVRKLFPDQRIHLIPNKSQKGLNTAENLHIHSDFESFNKVLSE